MDVALSIDGDQYCVYHHICDGKVFYIGSGTMARPFTRDGRSKRWLQFVKDHPQFDIRVVSRFQVLKEARQEESVQIKSMRPLCNGKATSEKSASTTEHISIRIPSDVMAALRRESLELERSVSWLIVRKLSGGSVEGHAERGPRSGDGAYKPPTKPLKIAITSGEQESIPAPQTKHHPRCVCSICKPK
jgi:uncharacterized protein (DUF4415 family)